MWIEILIGGAVWGVIVWFTLKIIEDIKIKKLKRRYNEEDDPGRKGEAAKQKEWKSNGVGFRASGKPIERKPDLQDAVINAKQELLQGGASGVDNDTTEFTSSDERESEDTKLNHRY